MTEWLPLLSTLVGGLIAIAGGLVGHHLSSKLTLRREHVTTRIQKLERVIEIAYEVLAWERARFTALIFTSDKGWGASPINQMQAMVILYFPSLLPDEVKIREALLTCRDAGIAALNKTAGKEKYLIDSRDLEEHNEAYKELSEAVGAFAMKARDFLPEEIR